MQWDPRKALAEVNLTSAWISYWISADSIITKRTIVGKLYHYVFVHYKISLVLQLHVLENKARKRVMDAGLIEMFDYLIFDQRK